MEFKGTKGKWKMVETDEGTHAVVLVERGAWSFGTTYIAQDICQGADEGAYDALLISKAPEILQFLIDHYRYLNIEDQEKAEKLIKSATQIK